MFRLISTNHLARDLRESPKQVGDDDCRGEGEGRQDPVDQLRLSLIVQFRAHSQNM